MSPFSALPNLFADCLKIRIFVHFDTEPVFAQATMRYPSLELIIFHIWILNLLFAF